MKRKYITVASCYTLAALLVLGCFILIEYRRAESYKRQLTDSQNRAFSLLVTEIGLIDSALQKCVYAGTTPMLAGMCADISGSSAAIKAALGDAPIPGEDYNKTSDFVTRTMNCAYLLAKKAGSGELPGDEDFTNLKKLSDTASSLTSRLSKIYVQPALNAVLTREKPVSAQNNRPVLLESTSEISRSEAAGAAASFMGVRQNSVKYEGFREEPVPVYLFSQSGSGGTVRAEVTRQGGYIASIVSSHSPQTVSVTPEEAVSAAGALLRKNGIYNMTPTHHTAEGKTVLAEFASTQDGVVCYPDLITVCIGLDNGAVTGFDSTGYIMNHRKRDFPVPEVTENDARANVSQKLEILSNVMAVITGADGNEIFCYEYLCKDESDRRCLVYINAQNGAEERIQVLQEPYNVSGSPLF